MRRHPSFVHRLLTSSFLLFALSSSLSAKGTDLDADLAGSAELPKRTVDVVKTKLKKSAKDIQKRIFDYEAKKKEAEALLKKAQEKGSKGYRMAKAVRDLIYATRGYRWEVAREPLIMAAQKMLEKASPIQGIMFSAQADLINDFINMKKDTEPVDWVARSAKMMEVRLEQMVKDLNKPADEMINKQMDKVCGAFGTSWEDVAQIYKEKGEKSILKTVQELMKKEEVQKSLLDFLKKGKDKLKKIAKDASQTDKQADAVEKRRQALEKKKLDRVKARNDAAAAKRNHALALQHLNTFKARMKAAAAAYDEKMVKRYSDRIESLRQEVDQERLKVEKADAEVTKVDGEIQKAAGELVQAERTLGENKEVAGWLDKLGKGKKGKTAGGMVEGMGARELRRALLKAEREAKKLQGKIRYLDGKRKEAQKYVDQAKEYARVAKGWIDLAKNFRDQRKALDVVYAIIHRDGRVPLGSLAGAQGAIKSILSGKFADIPDRIRAAVTMVKGIDVGKLDALFAEKLESTLDSEEGVAGLVGEERLETLKGKLSDMGKNFGEKFKVFEKLNKYLRGMEGKLDKIGMKLFGDKFKDQFKNLDFNKAFDDKVKEWGDKAIEKLDEYGKKFFGDYYESVKNAAKTIAAIIAKWDLDDPELAWLLDAQTNTGYYFEKPFVLELEAKDANSGVNPDGDYWGFSLNKKEVEKTGKGFRLDFKAIEQEEYYFLETKHKVCRPRVIMEGMAREHGHEQWYDFVGWIRDRAGHASNELTKRFRLICDTSPPDISVLKPRSDEAIEPGAAWTAQVLIEEDLSRVRLADVVLSITSVDQPEKYWDYRGTHASVKAKNLGEKTYPDGSFMKVQLDLQGPRDLPEGLYILTVRAVNGARNRWGRDHTFFVGDKYEDVVVSPDFEPSNLAYQAKEKFKLRFQAQNFGLRDITEIRVKPMVAPPGGSPFKKLEGPEALTIGSVAARKSDEGGEKGRAALKASGAFERYEVGEKVETASHIFKYEQEVRYADGDSRKKELDVLVRTEKEKGERPTYLQGNLLFSTASGDLLPVPRGTKITVSQVYKFPTFGGDQPKWIEQFVGFGQILDAEGFYKVQLRMVNQKDKRLRLVADALSVDTIMAELPGQKKKQLRRQAVAAVSSHLSKQPYRCITNVFSLPEGTPAADSRGLVVYKIDSKTIPYTLLPGEADRLPKEGADELRRSAKGIKITWEGELSTDGFINPYGVRMVDGISAGAIHNMQTAQMGSKMFAQGAEGIVGTIDAGLMYRNRTEALYILSQAVKGYDWSRKFIETFEKTPQYSFRGGFLPILTSTFAPPPPRDEKMPDPEEETIEDEPLEPIMPQEPPPPEDPPASKEPTAVTLTVIPERERSSVTAFVSMGAGVHWQYAPDDSGFKPTAARRLPDGRYAICDGGHDRLILVGGMGTVIWSCETVTDAEGTRQSFKDPEGMDWSPGGSILVADTGNRRVLEVDQEKRLLWSFGGGDDSPLLRPTRVGRNASGNVLILDEGAHAILEVDAEGEVVRRWGKDEGYEPLCFFLRPDDASLWIGDGKKGVVCLGPDGAVVKTLSSYRKWDEKAEEMKSRPLAGPTALWVTAEDDLFALYPKEKRLLVIHHSGDQVFHRENLADPRDVSQAGYMPPPSHAELTRVPLSEVGLTEPEQEEIVTEVDPWWEERQRREDEIARREEEEAAKARNRELDVTMTLSLESKRPKVHRRRPTKKIDIGGTMIYYPAAMIHKGSGPKYPHYYGWVRNRATAPSYGVYVDRENRFNDDEILRAYGAFIRARVFEGFKPGKGAFLHLADYRLERRQSPTEGGIRRAWENGWDHFFSCAVRDSLSFDHIKAGDGKLADPAGAFAEYLAQVQLEGDYAWLEALLNKAYRGLNCELAWTSIMWHLFQTYGELFLVNMAAFSSTSFLRYMPINVMAELFDATREYLAMGMLPAIRLETPEGSLPTLDHANPKISWHPNGVLEDAGQLKFRLLYDDRIDFATAREVAIPEGQGYSFDFGRIIGEADYASKLNNRLYSGTWYFKVLCDSPAFPLIDGKQTASSGIGAFHIQVPVEKIGASGGSYAFGEKGGVPGQVSLPEGAVNKDIDVSCQPIEIADEAGGDFVVGGRAMDFGPHGIKFDEVASFSFKYKEKDIPGLSEKAMVVKRWDPKLGKWVARKTTVDPVNNNVDASTDGFSVYALMIDRTPPVIESLGDSPDPLGGDGAVTLLTLRASENGYADVYVYDGQGKKLRSLCEEAEYSDFLHHLSWDLKDDAGALVPDGIYVVKATVRDYGGLRSRPASCKIHVSAECKAVLEGHVRLQGRTNGEVRVELLDTTRQVLSDAAGRFRLEALAPFAYDMRFTSEGFFPERRSAISVTGVTSMTESVMLEHDIVDSVEAEPELVTPDEDGVDDRFVCSYDLRRSARVSARVLDATGRVLRTLLKEESQTAGPNAVVWDGKNDRQDLVANGRYALEIHARIEDVTLLQIKRSFRVDVGLAQDCFALPAIFSPNGDGFEDRSEITYRMTEGGSVTLRILDGAGMVVRTLVKEQPGAAGVYRDGWNGKDETGQDVPDGRYRWEILPVYEDGTPSQVRRGPLLVDRVAPTLSDVSPVNGSRLTTGMPEITALVSCSPGDVTTADIRVKIDEHTVDPDFYDPASGLVRYRPATSLGEGVHIAIFYAYDAAGNAAAPAAVSFQVKFPGPAGADGEPGDYRDRTPPTVGGFHPDMDQIVYSRQPVLGCSFFDEHSGIDSKTLAFYLDGKKVANQVTFFIPGKTGKDWDWWQYQRAVIVYDPMRGHARFSPIAPIEELEGWHNYRFEACDRTGHVVRSPLIRFKVVLDEKAPVLEALTPEGGTVFHHGRPTVTATWKEEGGSGVGREGLRLHVNGRFVPSTELVFDEGKRSLSWTPREPLEEDTEHLVSLILRDRAGNLSEEGLTRFFCLPDRKPPVTLSSRPAFGQVLPLDPGTLQLRLLDEGSAGLDMASFRAYLDGERLLPLGADDASRRGFRWIVESTKGERMARVELIHPAAWKLGEHVLTYSVADGAGNRTEERLLRFRISEDTEIPVIEDMSPEHASMISPHAIYVSARLRDVGTGLDPSAIELRLDGRKVPVPPSALDLETGMLRHQFAAPIATGQSHLLGLVVRDLAGNSSRPWVSVVRAE